MHLPHCRITNHFLVNDRWYLVDLPGYGYARLGRKGREEIAAVIDDYILNSEELALLFVLIDSRHDIGTLDRDFIARLGEEGIPFAIVMTKCDKQGPNALAAQIEKDRQLLLENWEELPPIFESSSLDGRGVREILRHIENTLNSLTP